MVGAQRYYHRAGLPIDPIYGCVTTGSVWKFIRLSGSRVTFDGPEFNLHQIDRLLGILAFICVPPAVATAA